MTITRLRSLVWTLVVACACALAMPVWAQTTQSIAIRGHVQTLRLYGSRGNPPVIVSSGDGGWMHLGPHVAETLSAKGYFVVGFDVKAYLASFTSGRTTLRPEDEPGDYKVLVDFAARGATQKPLLVGVSEGAGLSVLAATDPVTKDSISGVIGLGLGDINELAWRFRDSIIYLTKGVPNEPSFSATAIAGRVTPAPLAAIHATHDEYVPLPEIRQLMDRANEPKRLWVIEASDHRFSNNVAEFDRRLLEAVAWVIESRKR